MIKKFKIQNSKFNVTPYRVRLSVFVLCSLLFALNATAQSDSIKTYSLNNVVVTGKKDANAPLPAQRLTAEKLENINAASVSDALRFFSGVQVKDYGGIGGLKTVNIRAMGSQHLGVFYDGIQIGNAQNGIVDLGRFSLDNIEMLSLHNGQQNRIFQSAKDFSAASAIYLTTKTPDFQENKRANFNATFRGGSFALLNPSITWQQKFSEKIYTSLNFEYLKADGKYKFRERYYDLDTVKTRQNGNIEAFRVEGGVFGKTAKGNWNAKAFYYDSWRQIPGAVIKNVIENYRHEQQWDKSFFAQTSVTQYFTEKYKILLNAKFASDYMRYYNNDENSKLFDNIYKQQEFYLSATQNYAVFDFWNIALSVDFQRNTLDANLQNFSYPVRNMELAVLATSLNLERLNIQANVLGTFVQENTDNQGIIGQAHNDGTIRQEFSPAIFAKYKLLKNSDLNIRGFYKRIFRLPTFNELYYTDFGSNLKPEIAAQYDLGIEFNVQNSKFKVQKAQTFHFNIDAYFNNVSNKILAFPKSPAQWAMMNFGKVYIFGIDFNAQNTTNFTENLTLNAQIAYTFTRAINLTDKRLNYGKLLMYQPQHSGTLLANLIYRNWNFNYNLTYCGLRYTDPANTAGAQLAAWNTSDISVFNRFSLKKINIKAGVELNNIFGAQYEIVKQYPMPSRNFRIILVCSM